MFKLLVVAPNGKQKIEEYPDMSGKYFDESKVLWDERLHGPMPDIELGHMSVEFVDEPVLDAVGDPVYENMEVPVLDEEGNPVTREITQPVFDSEMNPVYEMIEEPVFDEEGNPTYAQVEDPETGEMVDDLENPITQMVPNYMAPVMETVQVPVTQPVPNPEAPMTTQRRTLVIGEKTPEHAAAEAAEAMQAFMDRGEKAQAVGAKIIAAVWAMNESKEIDAAAFSAIMADENLKQIERLLWNGSLKTAKTLIQSLGTELFSAEEKAQVIALIDASGLV
jgi:hypothetical protein